MSTPVFNLSLDYWNHFSFPFAGPPTGTVDGQLYFHSRADVDVDEAGATAFVAPIWVRLPIISLGVLGPSFVGKIFGWTDSAGFTWYFACRWWTHTHAGFPNEYLSLYCVQCTDAGASPDTGR